MSPRVCLRGLIDRSAHLHLRSGARDPPDLDAIFRRVPVLATRFLSRAASLGDVQRSPLHRSKPRSTSPGRVRIRVAAPPHLSFGMEMPVPIRVPSSWFLTTSTVSPPRPCDRISGRCRSWGSSRFVPCANGFLAMHLLPFEAFPPPTAARAAETNLRFCAGSRHRLDLDTCVSSIAPFTANLAPSSFLRPRGLAPSSGPLLERPLPAVRARCSLGLVRSVPSPSWSPPPHRER